MTHREIALKKEADIGKALGDIGVLMTVFMIIAVLSLGAAYYYNQWWATLAILCLGVVFLSYEYLWKPTKEDHKKAIEELKK